MDINDNVFSIPPLDESSDVTDITTIEPEEIEVVEETVQTPIVNQVPNTNQVPNATQAQNAQQAPQANTQIPEAYQQEVQQAQAQGNVAPGTPIVIIHNDNSSNASTQQTVQQNVAQTQTVTQPLVQKNKWIAFFLCLFFGQAGFHQFYCGWIGKGLLMLGLSMTGIGLFISVPWAIINLVQILMGTFKVKNGLPI